MGVVLVRATNLKGELIVKIYKNFKELLRDDLSLSLIIQLMLGFFAHLMLDGGIMELLFAVNFLAYWILFLCILLRAVREYTWGDLFYIKFGILINIPLIYIVGLIVL